MCHLVVKLRQNTHQIQLNKRIILFRGNFDFFIFTFFKKEKKNYFLFKNNIYYIYSLKKKKNLIMKILFAKVLKIVISYKTSSVRKKKSDFAKFKNIFKKKP